jgi:SAM-dependent methyltransferase
MIELTRQIADRIEGDPAITTRGQAINRLRDLGLTDFGLCLISMPDPRYPKLSRLLPAMASEEVQRSWTGNAGTGLLRQTSAFVRALSFNYGRITGKDIGDASILDFGCGYGRMLRLMWFFAPESMVYGVDPWDQSLAECRKCGLTVNLTQSEYYPASLPVDRHQFDLIFAFSVFTHTSERATRAGLMTLRRYIAPTGLLAITVRPVEYWQVCPAGSSDAQVAAVERHRTDGYAFLPHDRPAIDGDVPYGETSMTLAWLRRNFPQWQIVVVDRSLDDELQLYVFLTPA